MSHPVSMIWGNLPPREGTKWPKPLQRKKIK